MREGEGRRGKEREGEGRREKERAGEGRREKERERKSGVRERPSA